MNSIDTCALYVYYVSLADSSVMKISEKVHGVRSTSGLFWLLLSLGAQCLATVGDCVMRGDKLTFLTHYFGVVARRVYSSYRAYLTLHYIL